MTTIASGETLPADFTRLGERAVLIDFGNRIDPDLNKKVMALCRWLKDHPFPGFIEAVPAYASAAVFFEPDAGGFSVEQPDPFERVTRHLRLGLNASTEFNPGRLITIPTLYDGPDLEFVASSHDLMIEEVIRIHEEVVYDAYMIGFLPGFAYLGQVDPVIATPRRSSPRTIVPSGSVGIAGRQTGIYPMDSPGGWQLIGRTPLQMFDPGRTEPCLIQAGDRVKFQSITEQEFLRYHGR